MTAASGTRPGCLPVRCSHPAPARSPAPPSLLLSSLALSPFSACSAFPPLSPSLVHHVLSLFVSPSCPVPHPQMSPLPVYPLPYPFSSLFLLFPPQLPVSIPFPPLCPLISAADVCGPQFSSLLPTHLLLFPQFPSSLISLLFEFARSPGGAGGLNPLRNDFLVPAPSRVETGTPRRFIRISGAGPGASPAPRPPPRRDGRGEPCSGFPRCQDTVGRGSSTGAAASPSRWLPARRRRSSLNRERGPGRENHGVGALG